VARALPFAPTVVLQLKKIKEFIIPKIATDAANAGISVPTVLSSWSVKR
jgi:hypothetical protein